MKTYYSIHIVIEIEIYLLMASLPCAFNHIFCFSLFARNGFVGLTRPAAFNGVDLCRALLSLCDCVMTAFENEESARLYLYQVGAYSVCRVRCAYASTYRHRQQQSSSKVSVNAAAAERELRLSFGAHSPLRCSAVATTPLRSA